MASPALRAATGATSALARCAGALFELLRLQQAGSRSAGAQPGGGVVAPMSPRCTHTCSAALAAGATAHTASSYSSTAQRPGGHAPSPQTAPSTAAGAVPLLRHPPAPEGAPLPTLAACPDLVALASHIERHGPRYTLLHVAAGLEALAAATVGGATPAPPPQPRQPQPQTTAAPSTSTSTSSSALSVNAPLAALCGQRLTLLSSHLLRKQLDILAVARALAAIARLTGATWAGAVALSFTERLRSPVYVKALPKQPRASLVALLGALGELLGMRPPVLRRGQVQKAAVTVVAALQPHVQQLSAEEAVRAAKAVASLPWAHDEATARDLLAALAAHVTDALLPHGALAAGDEARLLWAYGKAYGTSAERHSPADPGAGLTTAAEEDEQQEADVDEADDAGEADARRGARGAGAGASASHAASGGAPIPRVAGAEAGLPPPPPPPPPEVDSMVRQLAQAAARALGGQSTKHLAMLVGALARLDPQRAAARLLPQATPVLLERLDSMDNNFRATVAHAYHTARVHEPGLMQAAADAVLASGVTLTASDVMLMAPVYGAGGSASHAPMWAALRARARELAAAPAGGARRRAVRSAALAAMLAALDGQDAGDALLAAQLRMALQRLAAPP